MLKSGSFYCVKTVKCRPFLIKSWLPPLNFTEFGAPGSDVHIPQRNHCRDCSLDSFIDWCNLCKLIKTERKRRAITKPKIN